MIPPGSIARGAWFDTYGISPAIKTGKGGFLVEAFHERVGRYLGFHSPIDPGASAVTMNTLSDKYLQAALASLQAETSRCLGVVAAHANPPGSTATGSTAAGAAWKTSSWLMHKWFYSNNTKQKSYTHTSLKTLTTK
jgi:hypothetical protein